MVEEEFRWAGAEEGYACEGDVESDVEEDDENDALCREALEGARCEARGECCPKTLISVEFSESRMRLIEAGYSRACHETLTRSTTACKHSPTSATSSSV
jgi:hypothetical protein